jgi:hypothetical protein
MLNVLRFQSEKPGTRKPLVYFAGKISKGGWRDALIGHRAGGVLHDPCDAAPALFDPRFAIDCGEFRYGGPFFVNCDHGCAHGGNMHGANVESGCIDGANGFGGNQDAIRMRIWNVNLARIRRCDWVFGYLDAMDCYGTLIEVGLAAALDKPIALGLAPHLTSEHCDDLWFAQKAATTVHHGTAADCWVAAREWEQRGWPVKR